GLSMRTFWRSTMPSRPTDASTRSPTLRPTPSRTFLGMGTWNCRGRGQFLSTPPKVFVSGTSGDLRTARASQGRPLRDRLSSRRADHFRAGLPDGAEDRGGEDSGL